VQSAILRLKITKAEQIKMRRERVLELRAQGLTQQEIANELSPLDISRRTIGDDLQYLQANAFSIIRSRQANLAYEYEETLSNFYQMRKMIWAKLRLPDEQLEERNRQNYLHLLETVNHDIMHMHAIGDMVEAEMMQHLQDDERYVQEELDKKSDGQGNNNTQPPVF
jgi:DNA-binding transcriptional regulator LsrR (DeoR family)